MFKGTQNKILEERVHRGLDGINAPNNIDDGYCIEAENVDLSTPGKVSKRAGYVQYGCTLPVRTQKLVKSATETTLTLDYIPIQSVTLSLYLNTGANSAYFQSSEFKQIDDTYGTIFCTLTAHSTTLTTESILEITTPSGLVPVCPVLVFDDTHCLLPIYIQDLFSPIPTLSDTAAYTVVGRVCQGFSWPAIRESDVTQLVKVESGKVRIYADPDLVEVGSQILFETCLRPNLTLRGTIAGSVTAKDSESFYVDTEAFLGFTDTIEIHYLTIRVLTGGKYWFKSSAYSFVTYEKDYDGTTFNTKITGACTLQLKKTFAVEGTTLPAVGTYNVAGFFYGTTIDVGYLQTLSKYFDASVNAERLVTAYDGNVFAETTSPTTTASTISGLTYAGAQILLQATLATDTFDIPLTGAQLVYQASDVISIRYSTSTANNVYQEEILECYGTATNVLKLKAQGRKQLLLPARQKIAFTRTSSIIYLNSATEHLFAGMTLQLGVVNRQNPIYKTKIVTVDSSDATIGHNRITIDSSVDWSSDSTLTMMSVFKPIFQSGSETPIDSVYYNRSIRDVIATPMERSVFLACGKSGIYRYNGDKLLQMNIPRCPGGLIRNVRGNGGFLQTDPDTDTTRLGRTYEFIVTYSYAELVNGVLREYESGLTPTNTYDIISVQALDGSTNSQLVELQIPTIPEGIGLPASDMKINVYRTPSGKVSTQPTAEAWLLERQVANDPARPFVTVLAGTESPFLFTESNYKTLYSSISLDTTKDENSREIISPPLASIVAAYDNRLFAANGYEPPYVNVIANSVFDSAGAYSSPFTLTYADVLGNSYSFLSARLSTSTTSGVNAGDASNVKYQAIPVSPLEIKKITCSDTSNLFKIDTYGVTDAVLYCLRFWKGIKEDTVLGAARYYDNFGFHSQTFTGTAVANTVSAQKKWTAKTNAGTVIVPSDKVLVFKFLKSISGIGVNDGLFITGGSQSETKNAPVCFLRMTEAAPSVAVSNKLILMGAGTSGLLKKASGALLNWDRDIVANVTAVTSAGGVTEATLQLCELRDASAATAISAVAGLTADLFVSNTPDGVYCNPFTVLKLEGSQTAPFTEYAVSTFTLSPTTATIQLTTSPSFTGVVGQRAVCDQLPILPTATGMDWNQSFEIVSYLTDTFTVKVTLPSDLMGDCGKDMTADTTKGQLIVPNQYFTHTSNYIEFTLATTVLTVSAAINTWVYLACRGKEADNFNAQLSGFFKVVKLKKNDGNWYDSLAIGDSVTGVRVEWGTTAPDYAAFTGCSSTKIVFVDGATATAQKIAIPVPDTKTAQDFCGEMYGPQDGYTPLEKIVRRLAHGINTILRSHCFAYWGGSKLGNVVGVLPTNGLKIIPHLWPSNQYIFQHTTSTISSLEREPTWTLTAATGAFNIRGDSEYTSDGAAKVVRTAKEYQGARFWFTNSFDTLKAATRAFRQMSYDDIDSSDGEEIVALVPFQTFLLAFKRNSIWRIRFSDSPIPIKEKLPGIVGATSAKNLAVTERGVFFLSAYGLFITDGTMTEAIMQPTKIFNERVVQNSDYFYLCAGHHNPLTKTAYVGVPLSADVNSLATDISGQCVFNYSLKSITLDSINSGWSVNTNVPATMWMRILSDDYFASNVGKVYKLRSETTSSKYNDDESAIAFKLSTRHIHFGGDKAEVTSMRHTVFHFGKSTDSNIAVSYAQNYAMDYTPMVTFTIDRQTYGTTSWGEGYYGSDRLVEVLRKTPDQIRVNSVSLRFENSTLNQNVELMGIFTVGQAMDSKLIAQETKAR